METHPQLNLSIQIPIIAFTQTGGARVLSELANHWTRAGIKVTFLCANTNSTPYFPTIADIKYGDGKQKSSILLQFLSNFIIFIAFPHALWIAACIMHKHMSQNTIQTTLHL